MSRKQTLLGLALFLASAILIAALPTPPGGAGKTLGYKFLDHYTTSPIPTSFANTAYSRPVSGFKNATGFCAWTRTSTEDIEMNWSHTNAATVPSVANGVLPAPSSGAVSSFCADFAFPVQSIYLRGRTAAVSGYTAVWVY